MFWFNIGLHFSIYDAGVSAWREKLRNSRVRPPTVIQHLYTGEEILIDGGKTVRGQDFEAVWRIMPSSEWPSGSAAECQAVEEVIDSIFPHLELLFDGSIIEYTKDTLVVLPNTIMPFSHGKLNPSAEGYTSASMKDRCGETRREGGMHFTAAIDDGRTLAQGIGTQVGNKVIEFLPGVGSGDRTAREALAPTLNCDTETSACDGTWELPPLPNAMTIEEARVLFFQLPDIAMASAPPFNLLTRAHFATL